MNQELMSDQMIDVVTYKVVSDQSIQKISENVETECVNHKFSVLKAYDYNEILEGKGFPIDRRVFVYEICQARIASAMLTRVPQFSIFMPCRLAIYEDNGKTIISTMNMEVMLNAIESNPELHNAALELFNSLKSLMSNLSNS